MPKQEKRVYGEPVLESSLTTLQLAEKIALAVLKDAYDSGDGFLWEHAHKRAQAVLNVLHEARCRFCSVI